MNQVTIFECMAPGCGCKRLGSAMDVGKLSCPTHGTQLQGILYERVKPPGGWGASKSPTDAKEPA